MPHIDQARILQEMAAIGLDTLSEGVTDPLGHALADAAGGIAQTERVKKFLADWLASRTPAQLAHLQTAVRWSSRFTSSVLKVLARRIMTKHHVTGTMVHVVIDAIDDLCEILGRRTEAALTREQIRSYVNDAVDTAVENPSSTPTTAAHATEGETDMDTEFHLPEEAEELSARIANLIATGNRRMARRLGRLWRLRHESIHRDFVGELPGARTYGEAIRAAFATAPEDCVFLLSRRDLREDEDILQDEAIRAFFALAEIYLPHPSLKATLRDEQDRLVNGQMRGVIRQGGLTALGVVSRVGVWTLRAFGTLVIMGFVLVVGGIIAAVAGGVLATDSAGNYVTNMKWLGGGTVVSVVGFGALAVAEAMWQSAMNGLQKAGDVIGAPIEYAKVFAKAVAKAFGINIESETA